MLIPPLFLTLGLSLSSAGFQLRTGDTYDWSRQDLTGGMEAPVVMTVLGSSVPQGACADSGRVWNLRLEPDWAPAETVQVLEFHDGALRWLKWSKRFLPVELQDPRTAQAGWQRCGRFWGFNEPVAGVGPIFPAADYRITYDSLVGLPDGDLRARGVVWALSDLEGEPAMLLGYGGADGIWTDSVGPIRRAAGEYLAPVDWVLQARNGEPIGWTNPRMDSVRRFGSRDDRLGRFKIPLPGSRFRWRHTRWSISTTSTEISTHVDLRVVDGGLDSAGWVRRVFEVQETDAGGKSTAWTERRRWNTQGRQVVEGARYPVLEGAWRLDPEDRHNGNGQFLRRSVEPGGGTFDATYLESGSLYQTSYIASDSIAPGVTGQASWTLLWDSSVVVGVTPRSTRQAGTLSATSLRELAQQHPDAVVDFVAVSGRRGQLGLRDFLRDRRVSGVRSVRVVANGTILAQGLLLDP